MATITAKDMEIQAALAEKVVRNACNTVVDALGPVGLPLIAGQALAMLVECGLGHLAIEHLDDIRNLLNGVIKERAQAAN